MLLKNRNIFSKIKKSKVTDYAALTFLPFSFLVMHVTKISSILSHQTKHALDIKILLPYVLGICMSGTIYAVCIVMIKQNICFHSKDQDNICINFLILTMPEMT